MLTVGLTGGIGSGKSTVARMLEARGAVVVDADALAREAVEHGTPGFEAVLRRFGDAVRADDGSLDRQALAEVVFADPDARRDLEAIVHPQVRRRIAETIASHVGTDDVVVVESPLLVETGSDGDWTVLVVVAASPETQVFRLVARGMPEDDALARMAAQMPLEDKAAVADVVIDNEGSLEELRAQVDRLWDRLAIIRG
jgi:dephospho-CoA kinase